MWPRKTYRDGWHTHCSPPLTARVGTYTGPMSVIRRSVLLAAVAAVSLGAGEGERPATYQQRRLALAQKHSDGLVVLFGYGEREAQNARSSFRQENNFYYLTGWNEPGAVLLLLPADAKQPSYGEILFLPEKDASRERWTGPRTGPGEPDLDQKTGFSDVRDVSTLAPVVKEALVSYERVYGLLPRRHPSLAQQPEPDWTKTLKKLADGHPMSNVRGALGEMRMVKSEPEIQLIQQAVDATVEAHLAAWKRIRPGLFEYQVAAPMIERLMSLGCPRPAYAPIVGGGRRATILHYKKNSARLRSRELVLIDAGGEYGHYAADITRTVPVDGRFMDRQRKIYEAVLSAQKAAIASVKPGMTLAGNGPKSLHRIAQEELDSQGKDRNAKPLARYFTHGLGHHVGLGVHDPGDPKAPLKAGMVITIEPGVYIPEENIGVRIEDMVLVTSDGGRVLSSALPKEPHEIERIMGGRPQR